MLVVLAGSSFARPCALWNTLGEMEQ